MGSLTVQPGLALNLEPQIERRTVFPLKKGLGLGSVAQPPAHCSLSCRSSRNIWWHETGPDKRKHEVRSSVSS